MRTIRARRAAAVACGWLLALAPAALGWQRCAMASLFHVACPGCGMTRALLLLVRGHVRDSLHMHALALPMAAAVAFFAAATVAATYALGSPVEVHRTRFGRLAGGALAVVYAAGLALWVARAMGAFGGPPPV